MFDGVFHQGLERDRGDQEVFGGQVCDLDDHADGFGEADLEQVEVITYEFYFLAEEDQVSFFVGQDVAVNVGEGVVVETGVHGVAGDQEGEGIQGIEDKMGVDLVFEGFEFGLSFGDVKLFYPGFVVFFFQVEEKDLVDVGDEAAHDNQYKDGIEEVIVSGLGFVGSKQPEAEEERGQDTGVDDVGEEEGDDDPVVGSSGPGEQGPDIIHEPDVSFPDQKSDYYEIKIGGRQFGEGIEVVVDQTGEIRNEKSQGRNADKLDDPVV